MSQRLEQQFLEIEKRAAGLAKAASAASSAAKALLKAAKEGDPGTVERAIERAKAVTASLGAEAGRLADDTDLRDEHVEAYLATDYRAELVDAARQAGVPIREVMGLLSAYPTTIRIMPKERALTLDGKRTGVLRPSTVVALLKKNRDRSGAMPGEKFIETLYAAYKLVCGVDAHRKLTISAR